jgi:hypothetical protein
VGVGPGRRWPRSLDVSESPVAPASLHGRPAKRERAYPEDELRTAPLASGFSPIGLRLSPLSRESSLRRSSGC